ncbi:MAG TPA: type II CAAX endopeptidase family protein [Kofleriaceae bacterium]
MGEASPVEYHQLAHTNGRTRAVVEVVLAVALWYVLLEILLSGDMGSGDNTAAELILMGVVIGAMVPAAWLAARIVGRNPRQLSSVANRLRWPLLRKLLLIAVLLYVLELALKVGLAVALYGGEATFSEASWAGFATFVPLALTILVTVPLQVAGEEYFFRGTLLQAIGAFTPNARVAIVSTAVLFTLLHGADLAATIAIGIFGLAAAWLTIRTGGLEAALAYHVVGNVFGFLATAAIGDVGELLETMNDDTSWITFVFDVAGTLTFTAIVVKLVSAQRAPAAADQVEQHAAERRLGVEHADHGGNPEPLTP